MHYLGRKERQHFVAKTILWVTAITLFVAAIFYMAWGIKIGTSDTFVAVEKKT